jgi:light-regulated signal transduction histidine kinase (bacteriophytochrome)
MCFIQFYTMNYSKLYSKDLRNAIRHNHYNNGIGMDATKTSDKSFSFYMRFHSHIEGKGLGLYITKTQIEQLGGTIRAESNFVIVQSVCVLYTLHSTL